MAIPYRLHEAAKEEFIDAYGWYENRREGLGKQFMQEVENCIERISEHPEFFNRRKGNFRAAKVKRFPYSIVFEYFARKNLIHIAAIYHGRRSPRRKYRKAT